MQLLTTLENYRALRDRVPMVHWGQDEREQTAGVENCGYCAKGKACRHDQGDAMVGTVLKPLVSRSSASTHLQKLCELLADIDRQIDSYPLRVRALFHLRYRIGLPVETVMTSLGLRQRADYATVHDYYLGVMARKLSDWFERPDAWVREALHDLRQPVAA